MVEVEVEVEVITVGLTGALTGSTAWLRRGQ